MGDFIGVFFVLLLLAWVAGAVWFFRGPAKAAQSHLDRTVARISDERDRALFRQMYRARRPRNVVLAWLLTAALSPTISYVYQREWSKAVIAFLTFQGLGIWWLASIFTMPTEVMRHNKRLIDEAWTELQLARPGGQQVNVYAAAAGTEAFPSPPQPES